MWRRRRGRELWLITLQRRTTMITVIHPTIFALVSCKFAWNLVIEAMISVSLVWKVENISWISAELFLLRWVRGRPSWVPSPSWGLLTLPCLYWETSRLVLAPFKQYVFNNNSMYSTQCLQLDILQSALDQDDPNHILCALPTGFGKTMPMLLLGHLLPPGAGIPILETPCYSKTFQARWRDLATQPLGKGICRHIMLA